MTAELAYFSLAEQAAQVRGKEVSSRQLVEAYLARIDQIDGRLGAYLRVDAEGALAAADAVDQQIAAGDDPGPLAGVPVAVKDLFVTEGVETTAGSKILEGWIPPYDGTAVRKLRAAGAVILGKLNMDEFAMGSSNESSAYFPCRNPWDLDRIAGGSSGGSAAAVAAGLCAGALGTDTGGSIRQPAAMCGVVGIKPTYGRVSRYGVIAFASSLDQVGPLARNVEDAALLLEAVSGHDPHDSTSIDTPVPALAEAARIGADGGLEGVRVGLPSEYFAADLDPDVRSAVAAALAKLKELGAEGVEIELPHTELALPCYYLIAPAEASSNLARYDGIRYGARVTADGDDLLALYKKSRGAGFGPEVKRRIMVGTYALRSGYYDAYYLQAQKVRSLIKADFDRAFERVDLIISPTAPTPAFPLGAVASPVEMYQSDIFTLACNLAGLPGISVPCGLSKERLPIGLQLLGKPLGEPNLVRAAAAFEAAAEPIGRPPEVARG